MSQILNFRILLCTILSCSLFVLGGCKKKHNYDFSFTGKQVIDSVISFQSTAPAGSVFTWSFGDNTFSTDPAPTHIYVDYGTFTVSLTVSGNAAPVQKSISIPPPAGSEFTQNMSGLRKWHHTVSGIAGTYMSDTTFDIGVITKTKISFGSDIMIFDGFETVSGVKKLLFKYPIAPGETIYRNLQYYVDTDYIEERIVYIGYSVAYEYYSSFK